MDLVNVNIQRHAAHTVHRECFEYEIPVLLELFGEQSVVEAGRKAVAKDEVPDVQAAYDQLQARYGSTNDGAEALRSVYRSFDEFKRSFARKH